MTTTPDTTTHTAAADDTPAAEPTRPLSITWQHQDWRAELVARFGDDPTGWAFECPQCHDVATGAEFTAALDAHHLAHPDQRPRALGASFGQECIGRITPERGCRYAAFGLFRLGDTVIHDGRDVPVFPMAPATPRAGS